MFPYRKYIAPNYKNKHFPTILQTSFGEKRLEKIGKVKNPDRK